MLIISRSVMMGCVIGAMAYATALADVPSVRRADQTCGPYMLTNLTLLTIGLWSWCCPCIVYTKSRQRVRHLQNHGTRLATGGDPVDCQCWCYVCADCWAGLGWILQVCWDVTANLHNKSHITHSSPLRFPFAATFVVAIAFTETGFSIASCRLSAARVPSYKNAGKLSWRRTVSNKYK
jgi:hypothetical protein